MFYNSRFYILNQCFLTVKSIFPRCNVPLGLVLAMELSGTIINKEMEIPFVSVTIRTSYFLLYIEMCEQIVKNLKKIMYFCHFAQHLKNNFLPSQQWSNLKVGSTNVLLCASTPSWLPCKALPLFDVCIDISVMMSSNLPETCSSACANGHCFWLVWDTWPMRVVTQATLQMVPSTRIFVMKTYFYRTDINSIHRTSYIPEAFQCTHILPLQPIVRCFKPQFFIILNAM